MTGFSADWLALREPFDRAARDRALAQAFAAVLPDRACIVDLGGGTGSNIRYLEPVLARPHRWRLLDADAALLARAAALTAGLQVTCERFDLTGDLTAALADADAVTSSALMDLVSAGWFERLADALAARRLPFLAVLSVDGRTVFDPADGDDPLVLNAFATDQGRDKGFGPALGPAAPAFMAQALVHRGYTVRQAASDWRIGPGDGAMHHAFLAGVVGAAAQAAPAARADIAAWGARRRAQVDTRALSTVVGHIDLLAIYEGSRRA